MRRRRCCNMRLVVVNGLRLGDNGGRDRFCRLATGIWFWRRHNRVLFGVRNYLRRRGLRRRAQSFGRRRIAHNRQRLPLGAGKSMAAVICTRCSRHCSCSGRIMSRAGHRLRRLHRLRRRHPPLRGRELARRRQWFTVGARKSMGVIVRAQWSGCCGSGGGRIMRGGCSLWRLYLFCWRNLLLSGRQLASRWQGLAVDAGKHMCGGISSLRLR